LNPKNNHLFHRKAKNMLSPFEKRPKMRYFIFLVLSYVDVVWLSWETAHRLKKEIELAISLLAKKDRSVILFFIGSLP